MANNKKYLLTIDSENAPGTLYHIAGTMLRKKINIESLHVAEIDPKTHTSRFKIEIIVSPELIATLTKQIERIVEVVHADYKETK